jgi:hypothetical protein
MIKKILITVTAVFLCLVSILAVHIYLVTRPKPGAITSLSMGRVDFESPLDSLEASSIVSKVRQLDGIKDVRMNSAAGHMICLYDRKSWSGDELTSWIVDEFSVQASFFRPTEEMLSQSCPAIDKSSLTYRLGAFFQEKFEN